MYASATGPFVTPKTFNLEINTPSNEVCPALGDTPKGWCQEKSSNGLNYTQCTSNVDCGPDGPCRPFQKVRWAPIDEEEYMY